jgi:hypothetical protein
VADGAGVGAGIGHTGRAERGTAEDPGRHGGAVESVEVRIPQSGNKTCKVGARDAEALPGRGFGECLGAVDRRYLNGATRSAAVDGFSSDG